MTAEGVLSRLRRKPFVPFRLHLSGGTFHDIAHPEIMLVTKIGVIVAIYDPDQSSDDIPARDVLISYLHIPSVEDLPLKSRAAG
jgi:hypothetical protein